MSTVNQKIVLLIFSDCFDWPKTTVDIKTREKVNYIEHDKKKFK